jgi:uridine kinase
LDATRQVIDQNFDDFRLVDFDLLIKNVTELQNGKDTETPLYDFRKSGRYAYKKASPPESKVAIIEGIYALHDTILPLIDLKIAVSGGVHYDLVKRVFRDIQRTGQDANEVVKQITDTVYPMYKAFIEPSLEGADIKILNHYNPFAGLLSPTYTLKTDQTFSHDNIMDIIKKLRKSRPSLPQNAEDVAPAAQSYIDIFLAPPDEVETEKAEEDTELEDEQLVRESTNYIRVRNDNGIYSVLFSEYIREGKFIITPHMEFLIDVQTLGGLMALGYRVDAILNRKSTIYDVFNDNSLILMVDSIEQFGNQFLQIKGDNRELVEQVAELMNIRSFVRGSYIELFHIHQRSTYKESEILQSKL